MNTSLLPGIARALCLVVLCGHCQQAEPAAAGKWIDVAGYRIDISRASKAEVTTTLRTLQQQMEIIDAAGLSTEVMTFFHSVPIVIDPTLTGMNGAYAQMKGAWVVRARAGEWPPERSILLHELLHAYQQQVLKMPTPPIGSAFAQAQRNGTYPPEYRDAYFMSNPREFFAVIAEIYLSGPSFRPPYSCANVQKAQPGFIVWLAQVFGERECP